jgi:hypothetical protein
MKRLSVQKLLLATVILLLAATNAHATLRLAKTTYYSGDENYVHNWNEVYHYNPNHFVFIDSLVLYEDGEPADRVNDTWYCQTSFSNVGMGTILQHDYYNSQQVPQRTTITETDGWGRTVREIIFTGEGVPTRKTYRFYPSGNISQPDSVVQYLPLTYQNTLNWLKFTYSYDTAGRKDITNVYASPDSLIWSSLGWIENNYEGLLPFPIDTEQKLDFAYFINYDPSLSNSLPMILDPVGKLTSFTAYPATYPYSQYPPSTYTVNHYGGQPGENIYYMSVNGQGYNYFYNFHYNGKLARVSYYQYNEEGYNVWGRRFWWQDAVVDVDDGHAVPVAMVSTYPNPFTQGVNIKSVGAEMFEIQIFNIRGQLVRKLMFPGAKSVAWDGLDHNKASVPAGVYILKIKLADRYQVIRVLKM